MPSDLTAYTGNIFLRWLNDQADMPTRPTNLYIGLFNGNPKTSGTEVGATINSTNPRQEITFTDIAAGAAHLLTSSNAQDWGNAEGGASISHMALFDDPDPGQGNMYASKPLNGGTRTVTAGASVKYNTGAITFNVGSDT